MPLSDLAPRRSGSKAESFNRPLGIPEMALQGGGGVLAQVVLS